MREYRKNKLNGNFVVGHPAARVILNHVLIINLKNNLNRYLIIIFNPLLQQFRVIPISLIGGHKAIFSALIFCEIIHVFMF